MDSERDYTVAKSIVQSGLSNEAWEKIRNAEGPWPKHRKTWQQFRAYDLQELKNEMKLYKDSKGKVINNSFP